MESSGPTRVYVYPRHPVEYIHARARLMQLEPEWDLEEIWVWKIGWVMPSTSSQSWFPGYFHFPDEPKNYMI